MNFLHLASYSGNIGDNAHVEGLRRSLSQKLGSEPTFTDLEIRHFYHSWGHLKFDKKFSARANQADALIIGGGGFFDMNFPHSTTGTTINMPLETLNEITVPIVFYALGGNQLSPPNPECAKRFKNFIENLRLKQNCLVSVRNDGSKEVLLDHIGSEYEAFIQEIPDPAFFYKLRTSPPTQHEQILSAQNKRHIAICLAGDQAESRYTDSTTFHVNIATQFEQLLLEHPDINLVFFPHIHQDLETICGIVAKLSDPNRRLRIQIAPCFQGPGAEEYIFKLYQKCELVISNRFHALIIPYTLNVPIIAFCDNATRKVPSLMSKLNLDASKYTYELTLSNFRHQINKTLNSRKSATSARASELSQLSKTNDRFLDKFLSILNKP